MLMTKAYRATTLRKTIKNNILKKFKEQNWTKADLARAAHVSPGMVGRWLEGEDTPGWETLARLCKAFEEDASYFVTRQTRKRRNTAEEVTGEIGKES